MVQDILVCESQTNAVEIISRKFPGLFVFAQYIGPDAVCIWLLKFILCTVAYFRSTLSRWGPLPADPEAIEFQDPH